MVKTSIKKKFGDLTDKDSIYYVSPINQDIEGYKIKTIQGFSNEEIAKAPTLKYYVKVVVFHNVLALQSPEIEKIPTLTFVLDGRKYAQVCNVKVAFSENHKPTLPVPFFADINTVKEWKSST